MLKKVLENVVRVEKMVFSVSCVSRTMVVRGGRERGRGAECALCSVSVFMWCWAWDNNSSDLVDLSSAVTVIVRSCTLVVTC